MIISKNFFAKLRRKYYAFFPENILGEDISEKIKYEIDLVDKENIFLVTMTENLLTTHLS